MSDVLRFCVVPQRKTRIIYKQLLAYRQACEILKDLTDRGMLEQSNGYYLTTQFGSDFMENLEIIFGLWQISVLPPAPEIRR